GSRARHGQADAISAEVSSRLLALRERRPHWGPKKLRAALLREHPGLSGPASSTIGDLLKRHGLVASRRMRARGVEQIRPHEPATAPNELWGIDFKGWFRTA